MNYYMGTGHIGRDAESRRSPSGTEIVNFSVGVSVGYGDKQHTNWYECTLFGERGTKIAHMLTRGTKVGVRGEPDKRTYTDKSGVEKTVDTLRVDDVEFLERKAGGGERPQRATAQAAPQSNALDDDLVPF